MNWNFESLGNVCAILDNKRKPITKHQRVSGIYPYYGATGIVDYVNNFIFDERLVLVGEDGAKWKSGDRTAFIVEGKVWVNNHAHVLKPTGNLIDSFLIYFLNHQDLTNYITGLTVPKLNQEKLRSIPIPIPPLPEQQAIVEKLDFAFDAIEKAKANIEKNIENAKELFQSKLNEIFSQKGEGWEEKTLGDLGKISMCKRIMKDQTTEVGEIPFYKIGTFGKTPNAFISKEIFQEFSTKYSYPKKGEILLSASGTIGRCVVFDGEPSFFQDSNIVWITHDEKMVLNEFLFQFYKICNWNPSKGATISRLYNDDLRKIVINFPSIKKQKELIPQIKKLQEQTDFLQEKYKKKLANLEELKKSILEKAFKGELIQSLNL